MNYHSLSLLPFCFISGIALIYTYICSYLIGFYVVYADTVENIQANDNDGSEVEDCKEDHNSPGGIVYVR